MRRRALKSAASPSQLPLWDEFAGGTAGLKAAPPAPVAVALPVRATAYQRADLAIARIKALLTEPAQ